MRTIVATAAVLSLLGCSDTSVKPTKTSRDTSTAAAHAPMPPVPLWAADNLGWHTDKVIEYSHELTRNPRYYSGQTPLEYTEGKSPGGILFFHDFGEFRNQFKLSDSFIVLGARTVDRSGRLLAEAKVHYSIKGNTQGIELEEFHYDSAGRVIFNCNSDIDSDTGFKLTERNENGRKVRDYYFLWPIR